MAFFGLCFVYAAYRVFTFWRPAVVIDAGGLTDNSSALSAGRLRWEEIEYGAAHGAKQRMVVIVPKDLDASLARKGFFKRKVMEINLGRTYARTI